MAIRVRPRPFDDSDLVLRVLADRGHCLVAGPALIERMGNPAMPSELSEWPGLSMGAGKHLHKWELSGPEGAKAEIHFTPRLGDYRHAGAAGGSDGGCGRGTAAHFDGEGSAGFR